MERFSWELAWWIFFVENAPFCRRADDGTQWCRGICAMQRNLGRRSKGLFGSRYIESKMRRARVRSTSHRRLPGIVRRVVSLSLYQRTPARKGMVPPIRFERTTFPLGGGCSIQLSYGGDGDLPDAACHNSAIIRGRRIRESPGLFARFWRVRSASLKELNAPAKLGYDK